jgi:glycosyltransferase involved in cell wall biosynthesis
MTNIAYTYDKNVTLSISMIVKNEEKMLEACLEGIKPLLDAVPSELVIVDTGSTDRTVEIARCYTDKIHHFDWVNDFSAARNFGLSKCVGAWFMFLDADDHFVDVAEMIEFFRDESISKNYSTAFYITRNFTTMNFDEHFRFYAHRIARKTDNLRFEGAIHEYFINYYTPAYYFNSYANHYGYAFETPELMRKKSERNLMLMEKELEINPDSLRNINHYIGSAVDFTDRCRELIERALTLADTSEEPVAYTAYFNAFQTYHKEKDNEKAMSALDRAIKKADPNNAILTEVFALKGVLFSELENYAEAEENIKKYLDYFEKYEKNQLNKDVLGFVISNYLVPEKRDELRLTLAVCILRQDRAAEALSAFDGVDFSALEAESFKALVNTASEIAKDKSAREAFISLCEKIISLGDENKTAFLEQALERLYYFDRSLAESFKSAGGDFARLMRICADGNHDGLEAFLGEADPLREGFSEAVFLAVKNNLDLSEAISKMNYELIRTHLAVIAHYNAALPSLAIKYQSDEFFFGDIKNLLFGVMLFEASMDNAETLNGTERAVLYTNFSKYASLYVQNVYNPDLLNDNDVGALPETHRFGYYITVANGALENGDKLGYIKTLKNALISCKSMNSAVKFLIEDFSARL